MSLPNYIVNLDELFESILKAYYNHLLYEGGKKKSESKHNKVESLNKREFLFSFSTPIFLEKVQFFISPKRNSGYNNYWELYLNDEILFDSVFAKEMDENKTLFSPMPIKEDSVLKFVFYNNNDIDLDIGYNIEYYEKDIIGNVIVVGVDDETREVILHTAMPFIPNSESQIKAPTIEGYSPLETHKDIMLQLPSLTQIVYFYYRKVD